MVLFGHSFCISVCRCSGQLYAVILGSCDRVNTEFLELIFHNLLVKEFMNGHVTVDGFHARKYIYYKTASIFTDVQVNHQLMCTNQFRLFQA